MRPRVLKSRTPEFRKFLAAILARRGGDSAGVDRAVSKIIADVRKRGDRALIELTAKFDHVKLTPATLRVTPAERHSAINRIPAKVAGVAEIVMVSPPSSEGERLAVLAAAEIAGVDEFYRVGGAHAVAALAYGTESIKPVDKIVGPGNSYVQAAKQMVYGVIDIDK